MEWSLQSHACLSGMLAAILEGLNPIPLIIRTAKLSLSINVLQNITPGHLTQYDIGWFESFSPLDVSDKSRLKVPPLVGVNSIWDTESTNTFIRNHPGN